MMLLKDLCDYLSGNETQEEAVFCGTNAFPQIPSGFLTGMLHVEDHRPELSRLSEDTDYAHVSSLLDLCPRQYAIARANNLQLSSSPTSAQRVVWEIGKFLEKYVVKNIRNYHGTSFTHSSVEIKNEEYKIIGEADLLLHVDEKVVVVTEIKTMNARDFEKLTTPLADHILQAALYRWLVSNYPVGYAKPHDHVILLYVAKDFIRGSPYKEFHVDTTAQTIQRGVEIALELAAELKDARENNIIPRRHVCDRIDCTRSKNCPVATICWSLPESGV